jgi:hypothetical protein
MSADYSARFYIERPVDHKLLSMTREWLGSPSRIQWMSLISAPGHGNTWLLQRLHAFVGKDKVAFGDIQKILVKGRSPDDWPPTSHSPLVENIAECYRASQRKPLRKIQRAVGAALLVLGLVVLACLLKGLGQYSGVGGEHWSSPVLWVITFLFDYVPQHWREFPILLFTDWASGALVTTIVLAAVAWVYRRLHLSQQSTGHGDEQLEYFRTSEGLGQALVEICRGCRGIMLLIDDAHRLQEKDQLLLTDLVKPPSGTALERFHRHNRILIVTMESQSSNWLERPSEVARALEVAKFTPIEVQNIAERLKKNADANTRAALDSCLIQAQADGSVNVLLDALNKNRESQLAKELRQEFQRAEDRGINSIFGLAELMLYQAVRQEPSIDKQTLLQWLESLESTGHLATFGLRLPRDLEWLIREFATSTLVHQKRQTLHFDLVRCQALQRSLKDPSQQLLLAQAHYFWFWNLTDKVVGLTVKPSQVMNLSAADQQAIKRGAWHAVQLSKALYLEKAPDVLKQAPKLTQQERRLRGIAAAAALLAAAAIYRSEGDLQEADDLILDTVEWLAGPSDPQQEEWLACAAHQLWQNYWLSGNPHTRERLSRELANQCPGLADEPIWCMHQRFEEMLQGKHELSPLPAEVPRSDPHLCNLHRLTETLWEIRQRHGLISPALRDAAVTICELADAEGDDIFASRLRQLQVAAYNERGQTDALDQALHQWRQRLTQTQLSLGDLGSEVLHVCDKARYWHLLAEVWQLGMARLAELYEEEEEKETAEKDLHARVQQACLTPPADTLLLPDYLWQEAQAAYSRTRQIAALLNWRSLLTEASFHLGVLLQAHTPKEQQTEMPPWWRRWDELFDQAIGLERELGWTIFTPAMHRIRWKFFKDLDQAHAIEDAYNAFQAAQHAYYPNALILDLHQQVRALLNNVGDSDTDRKRSAELYEIWARQLAPLPEARAHWKFDSLEHEQASALHYAAQAWRFLQDFKRAHQLLDEAEALLPLVPAQPTAVGGEPPELRDLRISLKVQRAWLLGAQRLKEEYRTAVHSIWHDLRSEDEMCANILGTLLDLEDQQKLLAEPWPLKAGEPLHSDPDNGNLSLPAEWFVGESPLHLENRFEFRFYQLLNLVSFLKLLQANQDSPLLRLLGSGGALLESHQLAHRNSPQQLFTTEILKLVAYLKWLNLNRFGEIGIQFARYGLYYRTSTQTRQLIINLLEAVRFFFKAVQPLDREELAALKLLMEYIPNSLHYRQEYIRVLCEAKDLMEHELRVREQAGGWIAAAYQARNYFEVLVDEELRSKELKAALQRSGQSPQKWEEERGKRQMVLPQAQSMYNSGDYLACKQLLDAILPAESSPWVFFYDLQVLDLWLQCADKLGQHMMEDFNRRAAQLRESTLKFIYQLGLTIRDQQAQSLALDIWKAIRHRRELTPSSS